jgi:hypothetical protein
MINWRLFFNFDIKIKQNRNCPAGLYSQLLIRHILYACVQKSTSLYKREVKLNIKILIYLECCISYLFCNNYNLCFLSDCFSFWSFTEEINWIIQYHFGDGISFFKIFGKKIIHAITKLNGSVLKKNIVIVIWCFLLPQWFIIICSTLLCSSIEKWSSMS